MLVKGSGRGVGDSARTRLAKVSTCGQRAADDGCGQGDAVAAVAQHTGSERSTCRDAQKGVNGVPGAIKPGDFVGEEFDERHEPSGPQNNRIRKEL